MPGMLTVAVCEGGGASCMWASILEGHGQIAYEAGGAAALNLVANHAAQDVRLNLVQQSDAFNAWGPFNSTVQLCPLRP